MGYIISTLLGIGLLIALVWTALFFRAWRQEHERRSQEELDAERDRLLKTPGESLFCVACQKPLGGPLPDEGCPQCHCAAFVVPDRLRGRIEQTKPGAIRYRLRG